MKLVASYAICLLAFGIVGCASTARRDSTRSTGIEPVRLYLHASGKISENGYSIPLIELPEYFLIYTRKNSFTLNLTLLEGAKDEDSYRIIRLARDAGFTSFELSFPRKNESEK
jgi:hypothetical protein